MTTLHFPPGEEPEDEETPLGRCRNPWCEASYVLITDLHSTGFCGLCCPLYGPFSCEDCAWDPDDDS